MKLLLVDDDEDIRTFLEFNLQKLKLNVQTAIDGQEAFNKFKSFQPEIVILDVMMPEIDGIELCKKIRHYNTQTYILMLSASSDDYTKIKAYEAGCDDFVGKPIKIQLFSKKINAIRSRIKRQEKSSSDNSFIADENVIDLSDIKIDLEKYTIQVKDKEHELPKKQFELFLLLARRPNKVFSREKIYNKIWGDTIVSDRTIDVHITRIRNKLKIDCIKSVKGVGYKFVLDT